MPRRRWRGFDDRFLTLVGIVLASMCVVYVNQKESLEEYLGKNVTVFLDFATAVIIMVGMRLRETFGRGRYREDDN